MCDVLRTRLGRRRLAQDRRRLRVLVQLVSAQPAAVMCGTQPSEHQLFSAASDITANSNSEALPERL